MYYPWKKQEKKSCPLKTVLIAVGVVVSVMAAMAVLYKLFKKYFKITFECGDCGDPCECCENGVCDELEPECCYVDDDDLTAEDADDAE